MTDTLTAAETLHSAARVLAGLDPDWAAEANGIGYSSADGPMGHSLAAIPPERWTPAILRAAWEMLRGYKTQLANAGIDITAVPEPPMPEGFETVEHSEYGAYRTNRGRQEAKAQAKEIKEAAARKIHRVGSELIVEFPYNGELVAAVRKVPGRQWDAGRKVNVFPLASAAALVCFAADHGFQVADEVQALADENPIEPNAEPELNVTLQDRTVVIRFEYDASLVAKVKQIDGAKWDKANRVWRAPFASAAQAVAFADANDLSVAEGLKQLAGQVTEEQERLKEASAALDADIDVPGMAEGMELRPFQRGGVAYALRTRRCFIADEMGLGKTVQAIAAAVAGEAMPVVCVVPNLALGNWPREIRKFFPTLSVETVGTTKPYPTQGADITLVPYSVVFEWADALVDQVKPRALIVDECHYVKNGSEKVTCPECGAKVKRNAKRCGRGHEFAAPQRRFTVKRTDGVMRLARAVPADGMVLLLSGTPVLNRPQELVNQLEALGRLDDFGGSWAFLQRYTGAHQDKFGNWDFSGSRHAAELHEKLRSTCYVRRLKRDVLPELPAREHVPQYLELAPKVMDEYRKVEADVVSFLAERARQLALESGLTDAEAQRAYWQKKMRAEAAEHLVRIGVLKYAAAKARFEQGVEWVDQFLADNEEAKIILFAERIEFVEALAEHFGDMAVKVRGGVSQDERFRDGGLIDRFQNDPSVRVFVGNIASAKEALTLTAASNVAFFEMDWTPAAHDQCIDRCYGRINDVHGAQGHYFLAPGTFDDDVFEVLAEKRKVVDAVTDGKEVTGGGSAAGDLLVRLANRGISEADLT